MAMADSAVDMALQGGLGQFRLKLLQAVDLEVSSLERRMKQDLAMAIPPSEARGVSVVSWDCSDGTLAVDMLPDINETKPVDAVEEPWNPRNTVGSQQGPDVHKVMLKKCGSYESASRGHLPQLSRQIRTLEFKAESFSHCATTLAHSPYFDLFWALVIGSNAAFLGAQLNYRDVNLFGVHLAYAILFFIELLLRLLASGPSRYCVGRGWAWNWLDLIVVSAAWIDIILELLGSSDQTDVNSSFRILRLFRVSRLLRIVKTIWIVRFVGALRTLVSSLVDTLKPLFWAMVLLFIIIYIAGVLFTDVVLEYFSENDQEATLLRYFGSLSHSIETLFRAISGGIDWAEAADALRPMGYVWVLFFQVYVAFCMFAVLNVMTGVFCHSAIQSAQSDHENRLDSRHEFRKHVSRIFERMDTSGDGKLTLAEFEMMFENEGMQAFLESAEINASDAWTLFASLDVDGDNVIDVDEFTKRCMSLRGPARSMDVFAVIRHNLKIREQLQNVNERISQLSLEVSRLEPLSM